MTKPLILHAGCANTLLKNSDPKYYTFEFEEDRLDLDPKVDHTILGSVTEIPTRDDRYDIVHCYHCLEHLPAHDVSKALSEFKRVLKPGGELRLMVPDLESACSLLLSRGAEGVIYVADVGPITPLDMIFGHRGMVNSGFFGMSHKTGFTLATLKKFVVSMGFEKIEAERREVDIKVRGYKCCN